MRSTRLALCQTLAGALGHGLTPTDLPLNGAQWQEVLRLSSLHLVTPMLRRAFLEHGLVPHLPAGVAEFLDAVYVLNKQGNLDYENQLAQLNRRLNDIGVRPVLLKGAAALVSGLYSAPTDRMTGDIDVLIPASKLGAAVKHLYASGSRSINGNQELPMAEAYGLENHHYPRISCTDWPAPVELHVHTVPVPLNQLLGGDEVVRDAIPLCCGYAHCLIPSPTHFVMQNVIHSSLVDQKKHGFLSLRQLFEFVRACRVYQGQIDLAAIVHRFDSLGYGTALRNYMTRANAYLGLQLTPELALSGWDRRRHDLYRIELQNPLIHTLFSQCRAVQMLVTIFVRHARNQLENPNELIKLFKLGSYLHLYKEASQSYRLVHM